MRRYIVWTLAIFLGWRVLPVTLAAQSLDDSHALPEAETHPLAVVHNRVDRKAPARWEAERDAALTELGVTLAQSLPGTLPDAAYESHPSATLQLARALYALGDPEPAMHHANILQVFQPDHPEVLWLNAIAALAAARQREADPPPPDVPQQGHRRAVLDRYDNALGALDRLDTPRADLLRRLAWQARVIAETGEAYRGHPLGVDIHAGMRVDVTAGLADLGWSIPNVIRETVGLLAADPRAIPAAGVLRGEALQLLGGALAEAGQPEAGVEALLGALAAVGADHPQATVYRERLAAYPPSLVDDARDQFHAHREGAPLPVLRWDDADTSHTHDHHYNHDLLPLWVLVELAVLLLVVRLIRQAWRRRGKG